MKKGLLHPRNRHQGQYDFSALEKICPELKKFVKPNHAGVPSIDFANPLAVKTLNRALLKEFYQIEEWNIPEPYLCPPIPGRADYLHYAADLLAELNAGEVPTGPEVRILDVGVGANCIYPIIGSQEYGWSFVGAEIDPGAFASATQIVDQNPNLKSNIEIRLQKNPKHIFQGIIKPSEGFAFSMCNPPFHSSEAEANEVNTRKWRNLGKAAVANFGGRSHELWCEGGEVAFVKAMIEESILIPKACLWFSSLVSKETSLGEIYDTLRANRIPDWRTIEMAQGQKKSRFVAWTFMKKLR